MGHDDILRMFFENPATSLQIRGIARALDISKTAADYHIRKLLKEKLVIKETKGVFPSFRANEDSEAYQFYKRLFGMRVLQESGAVNHLETECNPRCIILFGSFAKGEYDSNSDIDIFVQAKDVEIDLRKFEKRLKHNINVLFEPNLKRLSPELLNNVLNGMKLRGHIRL